MYTYVAYEHRVASEVPLAPLAPATGWSPDQADIVIREVDQPTIAERYAEESRTPGGRCVVSHYLEQLYYAVRSGREIELYREGKVGDDFVARCAISLPLAIALRQRGLTAFHGGCVARDGRAVGFMGPSGAGKSTLAEAFFQRGYDVFCDDLFVLRFDDGVPVALPGPTQIRLREGAGRALVEGYDALPLAWAESQQRFRPIAEGPRSPAPLARIYLINDASAEQTEISPIDARSAVFTLAAQTWAYKRFSDPKFAEAHMARLAALVGGGYVTGLPRVRGLDAIEDTVRVVEADAGIVSTEGPAVPAPLGAGPLAEPVTDR